jgi:diketogulonate reductase-like aldo/keto reductase
MATAQDARFFRPERAPRLEPLLAQKPWIVPIPGTTKRARLDENVGASRVERTPADLRDIDEAASKLTVHGDRYPEHLERMTGR